MELFDSLLKRYSQKITCVLFLGGEWEEDNLVKFLVHAHQAGLKTALYTGLEDVSDHLKRHLDYIKIGPWKYQLGGLSSPHTNQRFIDLTTNEILNHLFL